MLRIIRKAVRRFFRFFSPIPLKIFYYHEYLEPLQSENSMGNFQIGKFDLIRRKLLDEGLISPQNILTPHRLSDEDILLAHSQKYLHQLKNPLEVGRILNLSFVNMWDSHIFDYFRHVAGATVEGLNIAYRQKIPVVNLGGGYHHAHYDRGEGFCLINDVAIAILKLRSSVPDIRILVIDLDYHQSNGIIEYFKDDSSVYILSIQAANWMEINRNHIANIKISSEINYIDYEDILVRELQKAKQYFKPDVVIYLAGADVAENDTLGDMHFSEYDIFNRDKLVYNFVSDLGVPILVLAAGGYGSESWKYYYNFIKWMIKHPYKVS